MSLDLYQVLGVARDASEEQIRKAYRAIAQVSHPDKVGNDPAARARFEAATKAYRVLSDPSDRKRYDRGFVEIDSVASLFAHTRAGKKLLAVMLPTAPAAPQEGADRYVVVEASEGLLRNGGVHTLSLPQPAGEPLTLGVVIPPDAQQFGYVSIAKLGYPGKKGAESGDLRLVFKPRRSS